MDLGDQKSLYDSFEDGDKSNDSAILDVVWASTQSPGNQIMSRMLRDAHGQLLCIYARAQKPQLSLTLQMRRKGDKVVVARWPFDAS